MVEEICRRELGNLGMEREGSRVEAYVTSDESAVNEVKGVVIKRRRPDVKRVVDDMVEEKEMGRIAVLVCGPSRMADEVRDAVRGVLARGVKGVEFVDETFGR